MRNSVSYIRILILSALLSALPWMARAQSGAVIQHSIDSLENLISRDTNRARLAILSYELACKYEAIRDVNNLIASAEKADLYAQQINDYSTQINSCLLLGKYNLLNQNTPAAISNYLRARSVINKRTEDIDNQVKKNQLSKETADAWHKRDKEQEADIVTQIGRVYYNQKHYGKSIEYFNDALDMYKALGKDDKIIDLKKQLAPACNYVNDYDNALIHYEDLLKYYNNLDDWTNTKILYQTIGNIYLSKHDYPNLERVSRELFDKCCSRGNETCTEQLNAMNNYAYACIRQGKYADAETLLKQVENEDGPETSPYLRNEEDPDKIYSMLATSYTNLGVCHHNNGKYDECLDDLSKAFELRKKAKQFKEASSVANLLAHIYLLHGDIHNAEYYQKEAVNEAEVSGDRNALMEAYEGLSKVYEKNGQSDEALKFYKKSLDLSNEDRREKDELLRQKEEELKRLNENEKDIQQNIVEEDRRDRQLREQKLETERERQRSKDLDSINTLLLKNSEILERANEALLRERVASDSAAARATRNAELQNERVRQDSLLRVQNDSIYSMNKQREQEELKQKEQQEFQKQKTQRLIYILILAAIAVLFLIAFAVLARRKNVKLKHQQEKIEMQNKDLSMKNEEITSQKEKLQTAYDEISQQKEKLESANARINQQMFELQQQNELIEQSKKSITDSIVYAKRIQTAVSPSEDFLQQFSLDYFLFFQPRDIVSGDYYWFHSIGKSVFICAADCTGHGVPGAFMSMLGLSLFNKIVAERGITEPDIILNNLRTEVKQALHQESINSSQKDGMDLSLVRFDMDTKMLHFAAANNNGYLLQHFGKDEEDKARENLLKPAHLRETPDGFLKLTVMPADSMPIGVYIRERDSFTMTSYQLKSGDTFYLSSDGYVDQFGGKWGRKFLSKNFQKLLLDINEYDMDRQKYEVVETHKHWIGAEYEQLDDIIVIGVRV